MARCIYTFRTGNIIAKMSVLEWALELLGDDVQPFIFESIRS
ncbi:hypothetical protein [Turicibacter sanguinis]|nr:hypothetical protein [Turicibacter sanguinis]EGC91814.1 hypothetical protein HMPREF9402_0201 [Turicibacter sp. HGF1]